MDKVVSDHLKDEINPGHIKNLLAISVAELGYISGIQDSICEDVYRHWKKDIDKLIDYHDHQHGVGIEKVIGYLSFWIRKLKPLSFARPLLSISESDGAVVVNEQFAHNHINELVSIYVVKLLLEGYFDEKANQATGERQKYYRQVVSNVGVSFNKLFASLLDGSLHKSFLYTCVYDMRFRTFGPHHVAHMVRYLIDNAGIDVASENKFFDAKEYISGARCKRVLHMSVFVSAPGDVQAKKISDTLDGDGQITKIFKTNYKKWIYEYGVAVTAVSLKDFESKINVDGPQAEIFKQLKTRGLVDVYCGIIDAKFGTPTAGFGSGTEAEYRSALKEIDPQLVMFGRNGTASVDVNDLSALQQKAEVEKFFSAEGGSKLLYWVYQEKDSKSNFEAKFIEQLEMKIKTYRDLCFA